MTKNKKYKNVERKCCQNERYLVVQCTVGKNGIEINEKRKMRENMTIRFTVIVVTNYIILFFMKFTFHSHNILFGTVFLILFLLYINSVFLSTSKQLFNLKAFTVREMVKHLCKYRVTQKHSIRHNICICSLVIKKKRNKMKMKKKNQLKEYRTRTHHLYIEFIS